MYDDGFGTELATLCPLCQGALPAWTFVRAGESSVGSGRGEGYADRWIREGRRVMPSSAQPPRESPVSQLLGTLPAVGSQGEAPNPGLILEQRKKAVKEIWE